MKLFDSHAHYQDVAFGTPEERTARISKILSGDILGILNVGTNPDSSRESLVLADAFPGVYAAVGLHPEDLSETDDPEAALRKIADMAAHPKAAAIGEIGLDYHYRDDNRAFQIEWFERQMALADSLSLPVIVHDRDAHGDCLSVVRNFPRVTGVFHSFSGSVETAAELIRRGWYISFSGVITFQNATRLAAVVPTVPDDRLLIETDCPYLTPHPYRGKRNDSGYLPLTAQKAAALRGQSVEALAEQTYRNALRLFRKIEDRNPL